MYRYIVELCIDSFVKASRLHIHRFHRDQNNLFFSYNYSILGTTIPDSISTNVCKTAHKKMARCDYFYVFLLKFGFMSF